MKERVMRAVADENIVDLADTFARHLELRLRPGRTLSPADLGDAEVLLVRSVTQVDEALLAGSRVRFVGTATIGTDHLDTDWLDGAGIGWAAAPGCNADAAAQYTLGMILLACQRLGRDPQTQRVGIIGHGNVGSRLRALLDALGVETMVNDPPLAHAGVTAHTHHWESLDATLACDIVCLHVPLTHEGAWPTADMIDAAALARMRPGALLVNAARGGVIAEADLQAALDRQAVHAALDVWPREPLIAPALLAAATVASPHVAGYSVEGKIRGTRMIFDAFLAWVGAVPHPDTNSTLAASSSSVEQLVIPAETADPVAEAVIAATGVEADDRRLRAVGKLTAAAFDVQRRAHAPRHEFSRIAVHAAPELARELAALGFSAGV